MEVSVLEGVCVVGELVELDGICVESVLLGVDDVLPVEGVLLVD